VICPQCDHPIDPAQPYDAGGTVGHFNLITRPCHLGCEIPAFTLVQPTPIIKPPELPMFTTLATEIAAQLPDWTLSFNDDKDAAFLSKDGMRFAITRTDKDRLHIRSWNWPKYTDETGKQIELMPHSLFDPRESAPSITCAIVRGSRAIAADITRRFLPEYLRIWSRLYARAVSNMAYSLDVRDNWRAVCTLARKDPEKTSHYLGEGYDVEVKQNGKHARFTIDATPEQAAKILEALK
jgi:hypothetical protein